MTQQAIPWEAPLFDPLPLSGKARLQAMIAPDPSTYFGDAWIARAFALFQRHRTEQKHLSPDFADLVGAAVAQENSCRYCYAATRMLLRARGFSADHIHELEQKLLDRDLSDKEAAGLNYVRSLTRSSPLPTQQDTKLLLDNGWAEPEIRELAYATATSGYFNRVTTISAFPAQNVERFGSGWRALLLRLFAGGDIRRRFERTEPAELSPDLLQGPYGYVVDSLADLPAAASLGLVLQMAWDESAISIRAKALVHAVVARGVGAPRAEREARALLLDQGLTAKEIEQTLDHLAGPQLDRIETQIVPFARETLWYQPADVQKRARLLRSELTREQLMDVIGISALANVVCRLSSLAEAQS